MYFIIVKPIQFGCIETCCTFFKFVFVLNMKELRYLCQWGSMVYKMVDVYKKGICFISIALNGNGCKLNLN